MAINRETIKNHFRTETVFVESLNDSIHLRDFSAAERLRLMVEFEQMNKVSEDKRAEMAQRLTCQVVQLTLVDDDHERLYSENEIDAMQNELPGDVVDEIADHALRFTQLVDAPESETPEKKQSKRGSSTT